VLLNHKGSLSEKVEEENGGTAANPDSRGKWLLKRTIGSRIGSSHIRPRNQSSRQHRSAPIFGRLRRVNAHDWLDFNKIRSTRSMDSIDF